VTLHTVWVITGPRSATEAADAVSASTSDQLHACVRDLNGTVAIVVTSRIAWHRHPSGDMSALTRSVAAAFARWDVCCGNELALDEIRQGQYTLERAIIDGEFTRVRPSAA
jgi:hypothetical protein